jgi:hypothetical protein
VFDPFDLRRHLGARPKEQRVSQRHRVFVSYHHANDEKYRNIFELRFGNANDILVRGSVQLGDIDPNLQTETVRQRIRDEYLRDTTVTVVLVGAQTWQRKHVDWEIASSIRDTRYNPRSGLLGILLPTHPGYPDRRYDPGTVPPRLFDNVKVGFAEVHAWSNDPDDVQAWIHKAYRVRKEVIPNNARPLFGKNRITDRWTD